MGVLCAPQFVDKHSYLRTTNGRPYIFIRKIAICRGRRPRRPIGMELFRQSRAYFVRPFLLPRMCKKYIGNVGCDAHIAP